MSILVPTDPCRKNLHLLHQSESRHDNIQNSEQGKESDLERNNHETSSVPNLHWATFKMAAPGSVEADLWNTIKIYILLGNAFFCYRFFSKYIWNILWDI